VHKIQRAGAWNSKNVLRPRFLRCPLLLLSSSQQLLSLWVRERLSSHPFLHPLASSIHKGHAVPLWNFTPETVASFCPHPPHPHSLLSGHSASGTDPRRCLRPKRRQQPRQLLGAKVKKLFLRTRQHKQHKQHKLIFFSHPADEPIHVVPTALQEGMHDFGKDPFTQKAFFLLFLITDLFIRQKPLREYCQNSEAEDVIVIAFLHVFNSASRQLPRMDLSNQCEPGSAL